MEEVKSYRKLLIESAIVHTLLQVFIATAWGLACFGMIDNWLKFSQDKQMLVHATGFTRLSAYIVSYTTLFFILKARNYKLKLPVFQSITAKDFLCILLIALGLFLVEKPIYDYQLLANTYLQTSFELPVYTKQEFSFTKIYHFVAILFLAPIAEELFFRHHILRGLQENYSQRLAIFTTNILFALVHFDNPFAVLTAFIFGLTVTYFILRSKNFYHAVLLHFISNLCYTLQNLFANQYMDFKQYLGVGWAYWVLVLLGLVFVVIGFGVQRKS